MKKTLVSLVFVVISIALYSQAKLDIIYLNNGTIVKGLIFEQSDTHIKIKTPDNTTYIFRISDIEKMEKEDAPTGISITSSTIAVTQNSNTASIEKPSYMIPPPPHFTNRKSYIGGGISAAFPVGEISTYINAGINVDLLNISYVGARNVGTTTRIFASFNNFDSRYNTQLTYLTLGVFTGLIVALPLGEAGFFDLRPMAGISTLSSYRGGMNFGFDLGASLRFNVSPYINLILSADFIISELSLNDGLNSSAKMLSANLGLAYRMK